MLCDSPAVIQSAETAEPSVFECFELFKAIAPDFVTIGRTLDDLAEQANAAHKAAEQAARAAVNHARDCGTTLLEAKKRLNHGEFSQWVRDNCEFSQRMANNYMAIARRWVDLANSQRVSNLESLSIRQALHLLAGDDDQKPKSGADADVFQGTTCPSCGKHLAKIKPGVITCISCFDCKVYGYGAGKSPARERFPYLDAIEAWKRMTALDRQKFLEAADGHEPPGWIGEAQQRRLSLPHVASQPAELKPETEAERYLRLEGGLNSMLTDLRAMASDLSSIDEGPELLRQFVEAVNAEGKS